MGNVGIVGETHGAGRHATLRSDLRLGAVDLTLALIATAALFVFLYWQAHQGDSDTYRTMGDHMDPDPDVYRYYWLSQAFGWTALLWSWTSVLAGLLTAASVSARLPGPRRGLVRLHRATSLTTIVLMAGHAWILVFGNMGETLLTVTVPWTGYPGGRFPLALGFGAFYGSILLGLTFYLQGRLGSRAWRAAHRLTVLTYALGVWHTLAYGSNVAFAGDWVRTVVWAAQLPVAALLLVRLARPLSRAERLGGRPLWRPKPLGRAALALAAAIATLALAFVVLAGHTGGDPSPVDEAEHVGH